MHTLLQASSGAGVTVIVLNLNLIMRYLFSCVCGWVTVPRREVAAFRLVRYGCQSVRARGGTGVYPGSVRYARLRIKPLFSRASASGMHQRTRTRIEKKSSSGSRARRYCQDIDSR